MRFVLDFYLPLTLVDLQLDSLSLTASTIRNDAVIPNNELGRIPKGAVMIYHKALHNQ
jgi:hypothetical protein